MERIAFYAWVVLLLIGTGLVNAWIAPRLFPVAGRINVRAAHLLVILSTILVTVGVLLMGESFPALSLQSSPDSPEVLTLVVIGAAIVSAATVHFAESRSRKRHPPGE